MADHKHDLRYSWPSEHVGVDTCLVKEADGKVSCLIKHYATPKDIEEYLTKVKNEKAHTDELLKEDLQKRADDLASEQTKVEALLE